MKWNSIEIYLDKKKRRKFFSEELLCLALLYLFQYNFENSIIEYFYE